MQYLLLCCVEETRRATMPPDAQQGQTVQEYAHSCRAS
jgi:hypothetical protein